MSENADGRPDAAEPRRVVGPRVVRLEIVCHDNGLVEVHGPVDHRPTVDYLLCEARRICEARWQQAARSGIIGG